jgi:MFS family permease
MEKLFNRHFFLLNFFGMPFFVLFPFYVEDVLRASTDWYGFLLAAFGIGALAGYTLAGTIPLSGRMRSRAMIVSLILMSGGFGGLGAVDVPIISIAIVLASGLLNGFFNINVITILQMTTPSELRGRVFGLLSTFAMGLAPIGLGLSGIVADLTNQNIPLIFMACGGILAALSILASMSREFRNFLEEK